MAWGLFICDISYKIGDNNAYFYSFIEFYGVFYRIFYGLWHFIAVYSVLCAQHSILLAHYWRYYLIFSDYYGHYSLLFADYFL